jgi:serine/threonine protein kinase
LTFHRVPYDCAAAGKVRAAGLPEALAARLGAGLAVALHDLHHQEVVHLDVKPSNVIVRPDGGVVLVDFGLARHAHYPDLLAEELRHPVGSPPYMAPEQVLGLRTRRRRFVRAAGSEPRDGARPTAQLLRAPIVLVAVATVRPDEERFEALRQGVRRFVASEGDARLACVAVIPPPPGLGSSGDDTPTRRRIRHLVLLRHWAEPLHLPPERISTHVVEAADAGEALLAYARANPVDHIVIGAPPEAVPPAGRGATVALRVAAAAPCTVTLVRPVRG